MSRVKRRLQQILCFLISACIFSSAGAFVSSAGEQKRVERLPSGRTLASEETEKFSVSEDKVYYIVSEPSGMVLDAYGQENYSEELANIQVYERGVSANKSQQFRFRKTAGGWYSIIPESNTSLAVNPYSSSPAAGDNVNLFSLIPEDRTQGWYVVPDGKFIAIRSAWDRKLLLTAEGNTNKSNVSLRKESWSSPKGSHRWSLVEVEKNTGKAGDTRDARYKAYADVVKQMEAEHGKPAFVHVDYYKPDSGKKCLAVLADFAGNGKEQLCLLYMEESTTWISGVAYIGGC